MYLYYIIHNFETSFCLRLDIFFQIHRYIVKDQLSVCTWQVFLDEINKFGQLSWCIFYEKIEIRQWISEYLTQVVLMSPNIQMALK